MGNILFFLLAFATIATLLYTGLQVFKEQEDPLGDRLDTLQSATMVAGTGKVRRKKGKGVMGLIASIPGADDWIKENEKRLRQAGAKSPKAIVIYTIFNIFFLALLLLGMLYIQRNNNPAQMIGGLVPQGGRAGTHVAAGPVVTRLRQIWFGLPPTWAFGVQEPNGAGALLVVLPQTW